MIYEVVVVGGKEYKAVRDEGLCCNCHFEKSLRCNVGGVFLCDEVESDVSIVFKPHYKLNHNSEV